MARLDQLERELCELGLSLESDQHGASSRGAADAVSTSLIGVDELVRELDVYERVLQVMSAEANKLDESMANTKETFDQQKSKIDSLRNRVGSTLAYICVSISK